MINALRSLFELPAKDSDEPIEHRLHLAAAALLIETARADFTQDGSEQEELARLLTTTLDLQAQEIQDLLSAAEQHVDEATSLYQYTRIINDHYNAAQKYQLIGSMWAVAYADGNIDKYEEHLIRKVADLIYVSHADYIRCKLDAQA